MLGCCGGPSSLPSPDNSQQEENFARASNPQQTENPAPREGNYLPPEIAAQPIEDEGEAEIQKLMNSGYKNMHAGDYQQSLRYFTEAEKVYLLESANFMPWIGKAEALCRSGDTAKGRFYARNFQCALNIIDERVTCAQMESSERVLKKSAQDMALCHAEFCASEIVRSIYEDSMPPEFEETIPPDQPFPKEAIDLYLYTARIRKLCGE
jgi:hypothetical protein